MPALESSQRHDPSLRLVIVDNGSNPPYPETEGVQIERIEKMVCYTAAINAGVKAAGAADWYLILNNDIKLDAPVTPMISKLDPSFVYGRQIIEGSGYRWLGLWLALIPSAVWDAVGGFDENFKMCGFDYADYCIRAKNLGIDTLWINLPITHFWGKTRWGIPGYKAARDETSNTL